MSSIIDRTPAKIAEVQMSLIWEKPDLRKIAEVLLSLFGQIVRFFVQNYRYSSG